MFKFRFFYLLSFICLFNSCAFIQSLRDDIDDPNERKKYAGEFDFSAPENRRLPPPPATVEDDSVKAIRGTPVDFSGYRAKSGRVTKKDFYEMANKNENSLWTEDGQQNYLFAQNKIKSPGDLITIIIDDGLRNDMIFEVKKLLPPEYRDREIIVPGITKNNVVSSVDKTKEKNENSESNNTNSSQSVTRVLNQDSSSSDRITAEVLERFPNGNLRIRGIKRIPFKTKTRNMEVIAIIRNSDIDASDSISSSKFLEHKVELYR
jgi:flagellar L-ring protein precursor FlgH